MNLTVPQVVRDFTERIGIVRVWQKQIVPRLITAILVSPVAITFAAAARAVLFETRNRSSVQRFYNRKSFKSRDLHQRACHMVIEQEAQKEKRKKRRWFLIVDGCCTKRGGFTKIENARKYREVKKKKRGPTSKAHTFIFGLLITDTGKRIPLPRKTWYTKQYCKKYKRQFVSMTKLMELIIEHAPIPGNVSLVVLVDEFFESQRLKQFCDSLSYTYICPVSSQRCFGDEQGKRLFNKTLYEYGKSLSREDLTTIQLRPSKEETASYRRYAESGMSKFKRVYRAASEVTNVAKLGQVRVVYSWKSPVCDPRRNDSRESYKVLLTNNSDLTLQQIIEYYELRWQIEVFFREIKSHIGLCDYRGVSFTAFERHVDMVLLAFLFLEYLRSQILVDKRFKGHERVARAAHVTDMLRFLSMLAAQDDLRFIEQSIKNEDAKTLLLTMIKKSIMKPAA